MKSGSEVTQLCPTLSDPMDCRLPGSSIHGIFQARVLEWVAIKIALILHASKTMLMANRWGNSGNSVRLYFWGAPKSLQMVTTAMKLKDAYSLEGKL